MMPLLDVFFAVMWFFGQGVVMPERSRGGTPTGCFGGDRICDNGLDTCTGDCQARDMLGALWDRGAPWRCWQ